MNKKKIQALLFAAGGILLLAGVIFLAAALMKDFSVGPEPSGSGTAETESTAGETEPETEKGTEAETEPEQESSARRRPVKPSAPVQPEEEEEVGYTPPTLYLASDLHYLSPRMTDFGKAFQMRIEADDGKVLPYLDEILDAYFEEVEEKKPSALILSGDITYNGEKVNHEELAKKLKKVQDAGIPVLVAPGNHDINHPWSASYFGDRERAVPTVDAEGFYDIYHEFGYDQAADRDPNSLSYLYKLDDRYWLMMLDTCIYDPVNEDGGRIRQSTLRWMKPWLEQAKKEGVTVIPVGHHNLLKESNVYVKESTLENNEEVIKLFEAYGLPVYISGHLHLQRVKKNMEGPASEGTGKYGIYEIVSGALSIPPCQYGIMKWDEEGGFTYHTEKVDVAGWAKEHQLKDPQLLNFSSYSSDFLVDVVMNQIFKALHSIPDDRKIGMARLYGLLNSVYCAGKVNRAWEVKKSQEYFYWERYMGSTKWFDRLSAILKDTNTDHNILSLTPGKDFPRVERPATNSDAQAGTAGRPGEDETAVSPEEGEAGPGTAG